MCNRLSAKIIKYGKKILPKGITEQILAVTTIARAPPHPMSCCMRMCLDSKIINTTSMLLVWLRCSFTVPSTAKIMHYYLVHQLQPFVMFCPFNYICASLHCHLFLTVMRRRVDLTSCPVDCFVFADI